MLVNICMKFHEGTWNGFWVTEQTWPYRKIYYFQFQRAITPKIRNPELRFLRSARRLMLLYNCVKFHENISNGFWVTERTRFCDRQTDGQTTRAKTICLPTLRGGDINILLQMVHLAFHEYEPFLIWKKKTLVNRILNYAEPCYGKGHPSKVGVLHWLLQQHWITEY